MNMLLCVRRTTIVLEDTLYKALRKKAAETGATFKALVSDAIRASLKEPAKKEGAYTFHLTTTRGEGLQPGVNLDSRQALYDFMDGIE